MYKEDDWEEVELTKEIEENLLEYKKKMGKDREKILFQIKKLKKMI